MLTFLIIFYSLVGLLGLTLLILKISGKKIKPVAGIIHGAAGLAGIALLIFYISFGKGDSLIITVLVFLFTFLIGGGMFSAVLFQKKYPVWILVIHIISGIAGLAMLFGFWIK